MKRVIYLLALLPLLASCEKELDFKYHDVESPLVIEATASQAGTSVKLTHTTPMDEPMDSLTVTDAMVTITDVTAGVTRTLPLLSDGTFGDAVAAESDHDYRVDVTCGDAIYSSICAMRRPTEILAMDFTWVKMPYDHVAVLQVSFRADPSDSDDCYWVRLLRNGKPYQWMTINSVNAVEGVINAVTMTTRRTVAEEDEKSLLTDGDVVTAVVTPISRRMMDYLTALSADSNGPAMWSGGFCLGYFLAAPVAEKSVVFHPDQIPE